MKHLRKQIAGYLLTLILLMAGIVFPGSGEKVLASGGSMAVHFLDVGQGLSILVQSEGQNLLYDGGPRSASSYVVSYLQEQNVSEIDYLISSHYDEDHVSGLIGCLNAFQVDNVIGADYIHDSSLYGSFMMQWQHMGLKYSIRQWGRSIHLARENLQFFHQRKSAKRVMLIRWQLS